MSDKGIVVLGEWGQFVDIDIEGMPLKKRVYYPRSRMSSYHGPLGLISPLKMYLAYMHPEPIDEEDEKPPKGWMNYEVFGMNLVYLVVVSTLSVGSVVLMC